MATEFIGQGWAFPVRTDATGRMALVADDQELREAIRLILGTAKGERPMRPEFGCDIHDLVFGVGDDEIAARIVYEVRTSLIRWEPRIEVLGVDISLYDHEAGVLYIDLTYRASNTNDPRNLVFPFYTIPAER